MAEERRPQGRGPGGGGGPRRGPGAHVDFKTLDFKKAGKNFKRILNIVWKRNGFLLVVIAFALVMSSITQIIGNGFLQTLIDDHISPFIVEETAYMAENKNTAVISVIGKDRVGIIAGVSKLLMENNININDISQTILDNLFTMIMLVDLQEVVIEKSDIVEKLNKLGEDLGVSITIQHTDLFNAMHRI